MLLRLIDYVLHLTWQHRACCGPRELPMIVPVVVSHAVGGWTGPCCSDELYACRPDLLGVADFVPRFTMLHLDLARTRDDVLRSIGADPFAVATLWALRESRNGDAMLRQFEAYADVLRAMLDQPHGRDEACQFLSYPWPRATGSRPSGSSTPCNGSYPSWSS